MNYKQIAREARKKVLEMIHSAGTSHIGSNFSVIDIATVLYEKAKPEDKILWSKGWAAATAYYFLSRKGIIPERDLDTYCQPKSPYIGLVEPTIPGIECAGGSMGYGLPFGVGFALAKKLKKEEGTVYVIMSDGELACGTTWESALIAAHHKLNNLIVIVDNNGFQAMGRTENILPIPTKYGGSFGDWESISVYGHSFEEIKKELNLRRKVSPKIIYAKTIKGKGVSFMENDNSWHYRKVDDESYELASKELGQ